MSRFERLTTSQTQIMKFTLTSLFGGVGYLMWNWDAVGLGILIGWTTYLIIVRPPLDDPEWFVVLWLPLAFDGIHLGWNTLVKEPADRLTRRGWVVLFINLFLSAIQIPHNLRLLMDLREFGRVNWVTFFLSLAVSLGMLSYMIDDIEGSLWGTQWRNQISTSLPHPGHFLSITIRMIACVSLLGVLVGLCN